MKVLSPLIPSHPIFKAGLFILLFILLAGLLLNLYLDPIITSLFQQQIGPLFEDNLTIGSIHLSLWQGSLILNKVSLKQPEGFGSGSMIAADSIKVRIKLLPLIQKKIFIDSIIMIRPNVHWVQQLHGATNFEYYTHLLNQASKPTDTAATSEPLVIHLNKLSISGGTFSFTSPRIADREPAVALKDIQIRLTNFQLPNPERNPAQFRIAGTIATPHPGRFECSGEGVFPGENLEFSAKNRISGIHLPDYGYLYPQSQLTVASGNAAVEGNIRSRNNYITSEQKVKISGLKVTTAKQKSITGTMMGISANAFIGLLNDKHKNLEFEFEVEGPVSQLKVHLKEKITTSVLKSLNRKLGFNKASVPKAPAAIQESGRKIKNKLNSVFGK